MDLSFKAQISDDDDDDDKSDASIVTNTTVNTLNERSPILFPTLQKFVLL
jgi:phage head maturation protease